MARFHKIRYFKGHRIITWKYKRNGITKFVAESRGYDNTYGQDAYLQMKKRIENEYAKRRTAKSD